MKRRVRSWLGIALAAIAAFAIAGFLSAGTACAHDPRFACSPRGANHPIAVANPRKSWAFYGHLAPGQEDRYEIELTQPAEVSWSLLVDERDARNPGRPEATLSASGRVLAHLDLTHAATFYEPFSRETYLSTAQTKVALPAGSSTAVIRMRAGTGAQRYTFAIGDAEQFSPLEIPYVFGAIERIRALHY